MRFASIRLIADDLHALVGFYETVTGITATWGAPQFAELATEGVTLAIAGTPTLALFNDAPARPADNHSVIVEFQVDDVDATLDVVRTTGAEIVQEPTTMPWGNRSLLFRDPEGTLVNFFTPVSREARAKYGLD